MPVDYFHYGSYFRIIKSARLNSLYKSLFCKRNLGFNRAQADGLAAGFWRAECVLYGSALWLGSEEAVTGGGGRGRAPPPPALHGLQLGFAVVHTCRRAACPGRVSPTTDEHKDCSRLWAGIAVRSLVWAEPPLTRGAGSHGGRGARGGLRLLQASQKACPGVEGSLKRHRFLKRHFRWQEGVLQGRVWPRGVSSILGRLGAPASNLPRR